MVPARCVGQTDRLPAARIEVPVLAAERDRVLAAVGEGLVLADAANQRENGHCLFSYRSKRRQSAPRSLIGILAALLLGLAGSCILLLLTFWGI